MRNTLFILLIIPFLCQGQIGAVRQMMESASREQASTDFVQSLGPDFYFVKTSIDNSTSTWDDVSGNGYEATTGGGTVTYTDNTKVSLAASAWVNVTDDASLDVDLGVETFTVILKFGPSIVANSGYYFSKSEGTTGERAFAFVAGAGPAIASVYAGGTLITATGGGLSGGELIIATVSTTLLNVWKDGTQIITNQTIGTGDGDLAPWIFGARIAGAAVVNSTVEYEMAALIKGVVVDGTQRTNIAGQWQTN